MANTHKQRGAASLFAVIFATLLLTVLTVGFIKLMILDQQQATNNNLSQGAYDAALAGVEDAKRVVRAAQTGNTAATQALVNFGDACNVIRRSGVVNGASDTETIVKSGTLSTGQVFDQAYTCVKIAMNTKDFIYKAVEDKSQVIPLRATGDFDTVVIEWYKRDDEGNSGEDATSPANESSMTGLLYNKSTWGASTPSLMRTQIINPGESFNLEQLDKTGSTMFLRPYVPRSDIPSASLENGTSLTASAHPRATDGHAHDNDVSITTCSKSFRFSGTYACKASINVGTITRNASANAFLRLNSIYKGASVKVSLKNGHSIVSFDGVQPAVDSTGRASNLFRRVEARLQIGDDFAYPDNAIELINSLCKDFSVTDSGHSYGECKPY